MKKFVLNVVLGSLFLLGTATGATISFSDSQSTSFTPSTLNFNLSLFDSSLGTLTKVTIEYEATLDGQFQVRNGSSSDGTLSGNMLGAFTLDGPAPLGTIISLAPTAPLGPRPVTAGETINFNVLNAHDANSAVFTNPADLALFIGVGSFGLLGDATAFASPTANFTPVFLEALLNGEATVKITYEYGSSEVPEPSTLAMAGFGGALLLFGSYRKRSAK